MMSEPLIQVKNLVYLSLNSIYIIILLTITDVYSSPTVVPPLKKIILISSFSLTP